MLKQFRILCLLPLGLLACPAATPRLQTQGSRMTMNPPKGPGEEDMKFMKTAAIGNMAEIQLGQMAQQKGADAAVRQFGQRLVKDHSTNLQQVRKLAGTQHVGLPVGLDPPHKAQKSALAKQTGAQFDRDFLLVMVQDHTKTIDLFRREATTSHDTAARAFAQQSLPVLESHLAEAKKIQAKLAGTAAP